MERTQYRSHEAVVEGILPELPELPVEVDRAWHAFSGAFDAVMSQVTDAPTVADVVNRADELIALARARKAYYEALLEAGILLHTDEALDDWDLWGLHPVNVGAGR